MRRRDFVRHSALGGAALLGGGLPALGFNGLHALPSESELGSLKGGLENAVFDLEEATILGLQRDMVTGKRTARSITQQYLERIESLDHRGPALHHMLDINPDALSIAASLDRERAERRVRGPLHGIPILLKDNIDTGDRMTTTAGSLALEGSIAPGDAFIARKLRDAGAILLGKTNLSEWANFRSTHSSSGWSGRGGQGKNPYVLDRNPCGSSSGSGGAISANYAAAAVGSETDGSIVCPASINGIVGIKPTLGLLSRSGIIPIAHSQDTAGPMTRTVADAALLLTVMAGVDPTDSATLASRGRTRIDYTRSLDANGLRGARIGVARKRFFGYSESADRLVNEAIAVMKSRGAVIIDPADIPNAGTYDDTEFEVLLYEFKADLNKYLAGLRPNIRARTLKDLIDFNERNRDREMPYFGQEIFLMAEKKGPLTEKKYRDALAKNHRNSRSQGIDAVMKKHRLDAIVAPTGTPAWPTDLINGDHFSGASSTPAAVAGYPNINVPVGFAHGLPVGMSIMGRAWSEPTLIRIAYSFEQATHHRRPPRFLPTLGVT
ncbi:MAG TPA: amidase [Gemmatimonadaceae bacterium]|nr:amidase [Gemmatimonadaceae bacterium]